MGQSSSLDYYDTYANPYATPAASPGDMASGVNWGGVGSALLGSATQLATTYLQAQGGAYQPSPVVIVGSGAAAHPTNNGPILLAGLGLAAFFLLKDERKHPAGH